MNKPFFLHQTDSQSVWVLQTHRDLLPQSHPNLNIHPAAGRDDALSEITRRFDLPHEPVFMKQVHGDTCLELNTAPAHHFWRSADACFTRRKEIMCAIMTADCLPVLITDEAASFVAAVHCGWRSLYRGILTKLLKKVQTPHPLVVWFGPAICAHHYQVDSFFKTHYLQAHPDANRAFTKVINGHCYADLKIMAKTQLAHQDIAHFKDASICTYQDDSYDSWRQNKTPSRQASMIWFSTIDHQG